MCLIKLVSQKVFIKLVCKSQCQHKSVNLLFISVLRKDKLTNLCGDRFLQTDFMSTFCEIKKLYPKPETPQTYSKPQTPNLNPESIPAQSLDE